jgi:hypothetical protein
MSICSRTGCTKALTTFVIWNNPKIHQVGKEKSWGACDEHLDYFVSYLTIRGFYLRIEKV